MKRIVVCMGMIGCLLCGCGAKEQPKDVKKTSETTTAVSEAAIVTPVSVTKDMSTGTKKSYKKYYTPEKGFNERKDGVTYGEKVYIHYNSKTTGTDRGAYVILPPGYSKSQKYPVVYLLHGIGGNEDEWFSGSPIEIAGNLIAEKKVVPYITVVPNVRARKNDQEISDMFSQENFDAFNNFINDLKNDLMPYIEKNYSVSTRVDQTAICGLSMGGMESLSIGFSMLDRFGYIGAFSPAPSLDTSLLTLEGSKTTPNLVMICNGDSDGTVQDVPKNYHEVLVENKVKHIWYQVPGGDHNFDVWDNGLYNFVKRIF